MTREEAITKLKSQRDEICNGCLHAVGWCESHCGFSEAIDMAIKALKQPEIVQCKDCDLNDGTCYCDFHYRNVKPNDYCSWRITTNG